MKKIHYILFTFLLFMASSIAIVAAQDAENMQGKERKFSVVVTTFPIYDYVREIIGAAPSNFDVNLIIDSGIDLHNFQPSAEDIATISNADMFIYNGGESDAWVKKILAQAMNKNIKVIDLMTSLGDKVKKERIVQGMQEHEHHGHHDCAHEHHDHVHEHRHDATIYDEHVWLSLKNAILMCKTLSSELQAKDSANATQYAENTKNYINKLTALHDKYAKIFQDLQNKTVLFADRFPFRYLLDDYGINYFAAFPGCSAETEASFETVIFLSQKINELKLKNIFIIDNSTNNIAQAIIGNSKQKDTATLSLNSLQTVTAKELAAGISYIKVMQDNLQKLHQGLKP